MRTHDLKCWTMYFEDIIAGIKTFEIRKNDRDFVGGDLLNLQDWDPDSSMYTGRKAFVRVTHLMHGGQFGLAEGYCCMSIRLTDGT